MRPNTLVCIGLFAAVAASSCAGLPARLRGHTYPPDFRYIERSEIRSAMWQLASDVHQLDELMRRPGPVDEAQRAQIAALLSAMDDTARSLATSGRPTNHPLIEDNLEGFRQALATARTSIASEHPNYYLVGSVSGACLGCHGPEH